MIGTIANSAARPNNTAIISHACTHELSLNSVVLRTDFVADEMPRMKPKPKEMMARITRPGFRTASIRD